MSTKEDIDRLVKLLALWLVEIRLYNDLNLYDINSLAENIAAKLLNLVYDLELKNLNTEKNNFSGIDLGDDTKKIAFQVTSRYDNKKIKDNIDTFAEKHAKRFSNGYNGPL